MPRGSYRRTRRAREETSGSTVAHIASDALSIGKFLLNLLNVEYKWYDTSFSTSAASSAATQSVCLTRIPNGTTSQTRNGQSVLAKSLQIRTQVSANLELLNAASITQWSYTIRFMVVQVHNEDVLSAAIPISEVLKAGGVLQPLNEDYPGRYKVLTDRVFQISSGSNYVEAIDKFHELDHHLTWGQASSGPDPSPVVDLRDGHIWTFTFYDQHFDSGENPIPPVWDCITRLRFIDN